MKLRIKGNSLRYRLSKTDMQTLEHIGHVQEETDFGATMLTYTLGRSNDVKELTTTFTNSTINITLPEAWAQELIKTERVGFETYAEVGDGKILYLLIEKDFKCLDEETGEDQSDNYDHPIMAEGNEGTERNEANKLDSENKESNKE